MDNRNKKNGFWKMTMGFIFIIILGLAIMGIVSWYEGQAGVSIGFDSIINIC